tara:strand:- start:4464 stop:4685 length:222 start_codon:yes stop_codon:yes gene_type:complete
MKLTKNFYELLCNRYKKAIDENTSNIASEIEQLVNTRKNTKEHTILEKIYNISEAKDKLESLRDFWKHNDTSK